MDFINLFLNSKTDNYTLSPVKQFGIEIDEFSRVYGRIIIVGHLVYMPNKNYRSKKQFEHYKENNTINIPVMIVLLEEENRIVAEMKNIGNFFLNKYDEYIKNYTSILAFGYVKNPKPRKNGKTGRSFKVHRQKRFIIPVERLIYKDIDNEFKFCSPLAIHCTFRQKLI